MNADTSNHPKTQRVPNEKWQASGLEFIKRCDKSLWDKAGVRALKYLHSLGLEDETLRHFRIGFNPNEAFDPLEKWGLPYEVNKNGNPKKVWLPRGIVIPYFAGNRLQRIKIRQYITKLQKEQGKNSDFFIKEDVFGMFGADYLRYQHPVILADNEFDAMLLYQVAGDIVEATSFGRPARNVGKEDWGKCAQNIFPISQMLVTYTNEDEKIIFIDSLPVYSKRANRAYLPDIPGVKTITDLKKAGVNPRDWLNEILSNVDFLGEKTCDMTDISPAVDENSSVVSMKEEILEGSVQGDQRLEENSSTKSVWKTIDFNGPLMYDPTIRPVTACGWCQKSDYWQRPDGGWVCSTCHPNPNNH
jgi:hypothetical protein